MALSLLPKSLSSGAGLVGSLAPYPSPMSAQGRGPVSTQAPNETWLAGHQTHLVVLVSPRGWSAQAEALPRAQWL